LNVLSICGSLRKGSFNAMVQRLLRPLAPDGMTIKPAPSLKREAEEEWGR
jgi:chromate reductase